jgi:hypothetical protein
MPRLCLNAEDRDDYGTTNWDINWHWENQIFIKTMDHHNDLWYAGKVCSDAPMHIQKRKYKPVVHGYPPLAEGQKAGKRVDPIVWPESQ